MKKPYLHDLQSQLLGTVTDTPEVLDYFSTDASIYRQAPAAVVYPKNTADVRRAVLLALERTAGNKPLSVTPRGSGTDQSGGALGAGLSLAFPAFMNKVLDMDRRTITVQPGANFWTVQQLLHAQARFLPAYPQSQHYSTIGGAVAAGAAGVKSVKYGSIRRYVRRVRVVLADGSLVTMGRLSPRQLHRKRGQSDLEGDIYRQIDRLVSDHRRLIQRAWPATVLNEAGYALDKVKDRDGSLDLAQLMVGSQGTLGVITEVTLESLPWNPKTSLVAGYLPDAEALQGALDKLGSLQPSALEMVDGRLLEQVRRRRPEDLAGLVPEQTPAFVLLAEFDEASQLQQLRKLRQAQRVLAKYAVSQRSTNNPLEQEALWRIPAAVAEVLWAGEGSAAALPVTGSAAVPVGKYAQAITLVERLAEKHGLSVVMWGHAGAGHLAVQPLASLGRKRDRELAPRFIQDFYGLVISLGGTVSALGGDGLARGGFLADQYGEEGYRLLQQVKQVFDPSGILNPLSKLSDHAYVPQLRDEYRLERGYEYYPQ